MSDLGGIVLFTLEVATLSTLLLLVPGILLARLLAVRGWRGRTLVETVITLPLVLPPTAVGFGLLWLFARRGPLGGLDVAFTWRAVVIACMVVSLPLLVRSARAGFEEVDPRLVGVARSLGRSPWRAFVEIELPLAWRGIVGGAVLAFTRALGEFGATILVAGNIPGRTQTLALALYQRVETGRTGEAAALAAVAVLLAAGFLLVVDRLTRRRELRLER